MKNQVLSLLFLLGCSGIAHAQTWTGAANDGNFNNPLNWTGNTAPTSATDATINASAGTVTLNAVGNVDNLTVGTGDVLAIGGNTLNVSGTSVSNSGTITSTDGFLTFSASVTLSGTGALTISDGAFVQQFTAGGTVSLTNSGNTIQGSGALGVNGLAFNNSSGTVNANVSGLTLGLNGGGSVTNTALLEATGGGILSITNNVNNAGGNITANGGTVNIGGSATISGGTLNSLNGGTLGTTDTATLQNVTISSGTNYNTGGMTNLQGTITNNGTMTSPNGFINVTGGDVTLQGGGSVVLVPGAVIRELPTGSTFTLHNVDNTITGAGEIGANGLSLDNQASGVVNANSSGNFLDLNDSTFTATVGNKGLLEATGGGILSITESVNNTSGNITANGGTVEIGGSSTITGGTLNSLNGGTLETNGTTTLNGVTISSGTTYGGGGTTNFIGTITNQGTITSANEFLTIAGSNVTLTGGGTISTTSDAFIDQTTGTSGFKLTNVNNLIEGSGQIGQDGLSFDNQVGGTVNANINASLSLNGGGTMTNEGLLEATNNGVLNINNVVTNSSGGLILANGGTVNLLTATIIGGTLTATGGGTIGTDGSATLENLTISSGTMYGAGAVTNLVGTITNQGTITSNDQFITITGGGATLTGGGTVQMNSDTFLDENGTGLTLHNAGNTIQGTGEIGQNGLSIDNQAGGTILANVMGGTLNIDGSGNMNNAGTFEATNGGSLVMPANTPFTTYNAGTQTLGGGTYIVSNSGTGTSLMKLNLGANTGGEIVNNAGVIILNGSNARTLFEDASGNNALTALAANTTSTSGLTVEGGYSLTTPGNFSNAGAVVVSAGGTDTGTLTIGTGSNTYTQTGGTTQINAGGTLSTGTGHVNVTGGSVTLAGGNIDTNTMNIGSTANVTGFGNVNGLGLGGVTNQGTIEASGGTLTMNSNVVGTTGTLKVDSGAALSVAPGLTGTAASTTGTLTQNGTLALGGNSVTVSTIYTNANFGTGNSFNNHAGVTGAGDQILAAGNTALTITGTAVGGTASAPTLNLANVHVGQSTTSTYSIENSGTTGPSVTGAIQTSVNGGNITAGNLSGTGVTASNFGQLAAGQSTTPYSVTVMGTTAGPLASGQTIHVASNFDNVTGPTLTLTGGAAYNLAQANTLTTPVNLGNVHTGQALGTNLSISNVAPVNASYTEGLGVSVTGTTGVATTSGTISTPLVAGAAPNTAIAVNLNTNTAGPLSGSATVGFTSVAVAGSGLSNTPLASQTVNVTGAAYNLAAASLGTISVSAVKGSTATTSLSVSNIGGASGSFTEGLDATVGTIATSLSGTPTSLLTSTNSLNGASTVAAGASGNLTFNVNTSQAGVVSGNVQVNLASDGGGSGSLAGTPVTSGLGVTGLTSQSATVNGNITVTVANTAQPSAAAPNPVTFNARLGATPPTQALSITNEAIGGPQEGLIGSISVTTASSPGTPVVTASGSFGAAQNGLAPGATNNTSLVVGVGTGTAGAINATATIALASDGSLNSLNGFAETPLTSQTVAVHGGIYQPAVASTLTSPIALGNTRIGGTLSQALSISNAAPDTGGYTETLGASFTGTTGAASVSGVPIMVAYGAAANTGLSVGLVTGTAGAITGSATLGFTTNAINGSGLGQASAGSQTVNLSGAVYQEAVGSTLPTNVALGTVRSGTVVNTALSVSNTAPTTAGLTYTETLGASFGATSAGLTGTGSVTGQVAGAAANTGMSVGYTAGAAGAYSGSATVNYVTQAVNNSGLGTLGVGSTTVGFTSTVNAIANGVVSTLSGGASFNTTANAGTLNFGTITAGSGLLQENLQLQNLIAALGLNPTDADLLTGTYLTNLIGSPFAFGGSTSVGDLAANSSDASDFDITFDTSATGTFSATLTIDEASHNAFQNDLNLTPYVLTIDGSVAPAGGGGGTVPDSGTTLLFLALGLTGLVLLSRRTRRLA